MNAKHPSKTGLTPLDHRAHSSSPTPSWRQNSVTQLRQLSLPSMCPPPRKQTKHVINGTSEYPRPTSSSPAPPPLDAREALTMLTHLGGGRLRCHRIPIQTRFPRSRQIDPVLAVRRHVERPNLARIATSRLVADVRGHARKIVMTDRSRRIDAGPMTAMSTTGKARGRALTDPGAHPGGATVVHALQIRLADADLRD